MVVSGNRKEGNKTSEKHNCILNARENARAVRTEITKECGSKLMPFIFLVKDGQEKKQCLDVNIRDFFYPNKTDE
jgi:uncharacterized alpha-E superfamily protein